MKIYWIRMTSLIAMAGSIAWAMLWYSQPQDIKTIEHYFGAGVVFLVAATFMFATLIRRPVKLTE